MPIYWMIKLTIQRSIRSRVSILILFLLLLFLFILPLTVLDDGSVKGKVQIQLMWTMGGSLILLSLFSLFNTIMNIRADVSERQIYLLEATPISRWQIIVGKLLGVFIMNLFLVIISGLISYIFVYIDYRNIYFANEKAENVLSKNPNDEASLLVKRDFHVLTNEVLSSRLKIEDYYDVEEMSNRALSIVKSKGSLPESEVELKKKYVEFFNKQSFFSVNAGEKGLRPILFKNPPKPNDKTLFYAFSYYLYTGNKIDGRIKGVWDVLIETENGQQEFVSLHQVDHAANIRNSIRISTEKLDRAKFIYFIFTNLSSQSVYSGMNEKFYLLVPYSEFELNFIKALFLILMKITLVSFVGACAASYLSFNVSVFITLSFLFFCYLSDFLLKFLTISRRYSPEALEDPTNYFVNLWNRLSVYIVNFFPDFANISGKALVDGEFIQNSILVNELIVNIFLRGGVFLLLSIVIFHFVEIGKDINDD